MDLKESEPPPHTPAVAARSPSATSPSAVVSRPSSTPTQLAAHTPTELAAASLPIPTPPCPTEEAKEVEPVGWGDADNIEDEPQPAIDEEETEKPIGLAAEINPMTSALLPRASSVSAVGSAGSSDDKMEAASIHLLHAGSMEDASIRPLHAEFDDGTPPATSIHPPSPQGSYHA